MHDESVPFENAICLDCTSGSQQFGDQLPLVDKVLRTTVRINERGAVSVDTQLLIDGVEHILEVNRPLDRFFTVTARGPNHLPVAKATASKMLMR